MRKILFIINPVAGHGNGSNLIVVISKFMEKHSIEYTIKVSNKIGNVTTLTEWGCENQYTDIIAVGGDGSLIEALNGLNLEQNIRLGIIPAGTGNDFARVLNLTKDYETCLEIIINGVTKPVDLCEVNGQRFINICSCGIDGEIILDTDRIKSKIRGSSAYILCTIKALISYQAKKVIIRIDGLELKREIIIVAVGNGKYVGGGMKITANAEIDDGLLDVCIINKLSKFKLLTLFPTIFKGQHIHIKPTVENFRGKNIQIDALQDRLLINADGNLIGMTPANMSITGKKVNFIYNPDKTEAM